ncbi:MAG: hypothetical protein WBD06_07450, partial [Acidobacteriaceae bacterium]
MAIFTSPGRARHPAPQSAPEAEAPAQAAKARPASTPDIRSPIAFEDTADAAGIRFQLKNSISPQR